MKCDFSSIAGLSPQNTRLVAFVLAMVWIVCGCLFLSLSFRSSAESQLIDFDVNTDLKGYIKLNDEYLEKTRAAKIDGFFFRY